MSVPFARDRLVAFKNGVKLSDWHGHSRSQHDALFQIQQDSLFLPRSLVQIYIRTLLFARTSSISNFSNTALSCGTLRARSSEKHGRHGTWILCGTGAVKSSALLENNCVTLIFTITECFESTHILPSLLRIAFNSPQSPVWFATPHHFPAAHLSAIGSFLPPKDLFLKGKINGGKLETSNRSLHLQPDLSIRSHTWLTTRCFNFTSGSFLHSKSASPFAIPRINSPGRIRSRHTKRVSSQAGVRMATRRIKFKSWPVTCQIEARASGLSNRRPHFLFQSKQYIR